jgi:hypothetical protein
MRPAASGPIVRVVKADDNLDGNVAKAPTPTVTVRRLDRGDFRIWLKQTADTTGVYWGRSSHSYEFLVLATDYTGNREQPPLGLCAPDDGCGAQKSHPRFEREWNPLERPSRSEPGVRLLRFR